MRSAGESSTHLGERRRRVRLPWGRPNREQPNRLLRRRDLACDAGADASEHAGLENVRLTAGMQSCRSRQRGVDLFLPVRNMVVLGKCSKCGGKFSTWIPNEVTPKLARARQNPPRLGESNSSTRLTTTSDIFCLL